MLYQCESLLSAFCLDFTFTIYCLSSLDVSTSLIAFHNMKLPFLLCDTCLTSHTSTSSSSVQSFLPNSSFPDPRHQTETESSSPDQVVSLLLRAHREPLNTFSTSPPTNPLFHQPNQPTSLPTNPRTPDPAHPLRRPPHCNALLPAFNKPLLLLSYLPFIIPHLSSPA